MPPPFSYCFFPDLVVKYPKGIGNAMYYLVCADKYVHT